VRRRRELVEQPGQAVSTTGKELRTAENSFPAVVSYNPDAPSFRLQEVHGFQEATSGLSLTELPVAARVLYRKRLF
jgi:hypothetical protein